MYGLSHCYAFIECGIWSVCVVKEKRVVNDTGTTFKSVQEFIPYTYYLVILRKLKPFPQLPLATLANKKFHPEQPFREESKKFSLYTNLY